MPNKNIHRILKTEKIIPQLRSEIHHEQIELTSKDAVTQTIAFDYRYYTEPTIASGITSLTYKSTDGKTYKTHLVTTLKEYLQDPDSKLYVGVRLFVRAMHLPNKLTYPIYGELPIIIMGHATNKYAGALEDAIPVVPENGTGTDDSIEFENDAPPAITGLSLVTRTYVEASKGQTPKAYIEASWDAVVHNDLQGYESDISEGDNLHYDNKPDSKFNSKTNMAWTGLKLNTLYYIRVRSVDLAGNYSDWVEASITTPSTYGTVAPPTNLQISEQPPQGIMLNWTASTSANVFGYEINRANVANGAIAPDFSASSKIGETRSTFYLDNYLDTTQDYYYWVRTISTDEHYSEWVASAGQAPHKINDLTAEANSLYDSLKLIDTAKLADNAVTTQKIAAGAVETEKLAAGAVTANKIATGALLTYNATIVNRLAGNNLTFTVYPNAINGSQYLSISSGTVYLSSYNGISWNKIACTINLASVYMSSGYDYYIYFTPSVDANGEPLAGTYSLSSSTSYPTGTYDIVVIYAHSYYSGHLAQYTIDAQKLGATGTVINGDHIQTGSLVAENLKAGTITATSACIGSLDASKITTGTLDTNLLTISGSNIHPENVTENANGYWAGEHGADITGSHTAKDIQYLPSTPSGSGLFANGTYLGYYDGANWKTYMDIYGHFYLSGSGVHHLSWDGATLDIRGSLNADDITAGTLTGRTIQTNTYADSSIKLYDGGGYYLPQLQFMYIGVLQHYIQESGGYLYIDGSSGATIHIGGTAPVSLDGVAYAVYGIILNNVTAIQGNSTNVLEIGSYYAVSAPTTTQTFIQSGSGTLSGGIATVSFGTYFNSNCVPKVVVTAKGSGVTSVLHTNNIYYYQFDVGTADADCSFDWIAIGYI